jgi:hypothetical protein
VQRRQFTRRKSANPIAPSLGRILALDVRAGSQELPRGFGFVVDVPRKRKVNPKPARLILNRAHFGGDCERGDSNPHAFRHQILSLARLPIPPLSRAKSRRPSFCDSTSGHFRQVASPVCKPGARAVKCKRQPDAEFLWFLPHRGSSPGCFFQGAPCTTHVAA